MTFMGKRLFLLPSEFLSQEEYLILEDPCSFSFYVLERKADPWGYMRGWGRGVLKGVSSPITGPVSVWGAGEVLGAGVWTWGLGRPGAASCLPAELVGTNLKTLLPLARANATDVSEKLGRSGAAFYGRWHLYFSGLDPGLLATCLVISSPNLLEGCVLSCECALLPVLMVRTQVCESSDTKLSCLLLLSQWTLQVWPWLGPPCWVSWWENIHTLQWVCDKNDGVKLCHN